MPSASFYQDPKLSVVSTVSVYLVVNASGWILGAKMAVEEEEHQGQSLEGGFLREVWKQVAGEHQLQEGPADGMGPGKKSQIHI